ncbi:MAG: hypothetical protein WAX77_04665 [Methylococcaceae bacterium]
MLEYPNIDKTLAAFVHNVPVNARRALMSKRKKISIRSNWKKVGGQWKPFNIRKRSFMSNTNASGKLARSLTGSIDGKVITFEMEYYGQFVNDGREGSVKFPPEQKIKTWLNQRKIKIRDEKGQFAKGGKGLSFLIGRKIKTFGIPPTGFFTNAFMKAWDKLPFDLDNAIAEDMDIIIDKLNSE